MSRNLYHILVISPLLIFSANSLIDLESARSSLLITTSWFPEASFTSFRAASALSISLHAIIIRAPKDKTAERQEDDIFPLGIILILNRIEMPTSLCQVYGCLFTNSSIGSSNYNSFTIKSGIRWPRAEHISEDERKRINVTWMQLLLSYYSTWFLWALVWYDK